MTTASIFGNSEQSLSTSALSTALLTGAVVPWSNLITILELDVSLFFVSVTLPFSTRRLSISTPDPSSMRRRALPSSSSPVTDRKVACAPIEATLRAVLAAPRQPLAGRGRPLWGRAPPCSPLDHPFEVDVHHGVPYDEDVQGAEEVYKIGGIMTQRLQTCCRPPFRLRAFYQVSPVPVGPAIP